MGRVYGVLKDLKTNSRAGPRGTSNHRGRDGCSTSEMRRVGMIIYAIRLASSRLAWHGDGKARA